MLQSPEFLAFGRGALNSNAGGSPLPGLLFLSSVIPRESSRLITHSPAQRGFHERNFANRSFEPARASILGEPVLRSLAMKSSFPVRPAPRALFRFPVPAIASFVALGFAVLGLAGCGERAVPRPNIILISIDTLRADRVGAYGHESAQTPHLDRLAREGIRFENAYAPTPLTLPSHASMLSGLDPPEHGVRLNGSYAFPRDVPTVATMLSDAGYDTGAFVSAYVLNASFGLERGFGTYDDRASATRLHIAERPASETVDLALDWLRNRSDRPFFLWLHFFDPHAPYEPPEPFASQFAADPYDGEVAATDAQIGRLLDWLDEYGLADSTLVAATSDHGEGLGDHGEQTHGLLIYDSTLRVPLILRPPAPADESAPAERGRVIREPAHLIDIAPTVLGAAGVEAPGAMRGYDLLALPPPADRVSYAESQYPMAFRWSPLEAWREGRWKYIRGHDRELFDTAGDPEESANQSGGQAERARAIESALDRFLHETESLHEAEFAAPELEQIETLGYVGGGAPQLGREDARSLPDPRPRIAVFETILLAMRDVQVGNAGGALERLAPLEATEQDNPWLHKILGRARIRKQDVEGGVRHLERFYELSSRSPEAAYDLALALNAAGRRDDAIATMHEGVEAEPRLARGWDLLGMLLGSSRDYAGALEAGERAIRLEPENKDFNVHFGTTLMNLGRFADASSHFQRALQIDPQNEAAARGLQIARSQLEAATAD